VGDPGTRAEVTLNALNRALAAELPWLQNERMALPLQPASSTCKLAGTMKSIGTINAVGIGAANAAVVQALIHWLLIHN
jgi:hypothetical protein